MTIKVQPINMITPPNAWANSKDNFWVVTDAVAIDLWGILTISDAMGSRPYVPAAGASLQATWMRGDYIGSITNQQLTVNKVASFDTNFRALVKISLIAQEATNVISGTIMFTLTEGSIINKWNQSWACKKLNTGAGF